jgi:hypothetical protein
MGIPLSGVGGFAFPGVIDLTENTILRIAPITSMNFQEQGNKKRSKIVNIDDYLTDTLYISVLNYHPYLWQGKTCHGSGKANLRKDTHEHTP